MKRARVSAEFLTTKAFVGPLVLIIGAVMTVAVVHDFVQFAKDAPVALAACAPVAYLVVRWVAPWLSVQLIGAPRQAVPASYPSNDAASQTP